MSGAHDEGEAVVDDQELRSAAVKRVEKRRAFPKQVLTFAAISVVLWVIWAVTGAGFVWPVFPMAAFLLALALGAYDVYGRSKPITEDEIQREMDRSRGSA
jgi:fatty acid desaturase